MVRFKGGLIMIRKETIEDITALLSAVQSIGRIEERLASIEAKICTLQPEKKVSDTMLIDDALEFLKDNGRPTSKSTLYKELSLGWIPSKRIGKRRVFSKKDLKTWLDAGMPKQIELNAADALAARINKYSKF